MRTRIGCLLFFALAGCCQAQAPLATLKANFETASAKLDTACEKQKAEALLVCEKQKADALAAYGKTLDALLADLKQKGNLVRYLAVQEEKKRFETEKTIPEDKDQQNEVLIAGRTYRAAVANADKTYRDGTAKAEADKNINGTVILKQYVAQLEGSIKQLMMQDRLQSAKEVQQELEKAGFMLADAESKVPPWIKAEMVFARSYPTRTDAGRMSALAKYGGSKAGETAVLKALRWLKRSQRDDGAWWGTDSPTAMCGLALLCYMAHGETPGSEEFGTTVEKAIQHLMSAQEPTGRFKAAGGNYAYGHAIATYALAESYGMTKMEMLKEPMEKGVQVIIDGQQAGGAFDYNYAKTARRDLSVTGWQVQALHAARTAGAKNNGLSDALYNCVKGVKSFAAPRGGFGYDGPGNSGVLTGVGILSLQLLGHPEDAAALKGFWVSERVVPAWPGAGGTTYGWYYMTQARFRRGGPQWDSWNQVMLPMLARNQQADGHWESGSTAAACPVYDTVLCCLCLEVYYRHSIIF